MRVGPEGPESVVEIEDYEPGEGLAVCESGGGEGGRFEDCGWWARVWRLCALFRHDEREDEGDREDVQDLRELCCSKRCTTCFVRLKIRVSGCVTYLTRRPQKILDRRHSSVDVRPHNGLEPVPDTLYTVQINYKISSS